MYLLHNNVNKMASPNLRFQDFEPSRPTHILQLLAAVVASYYINRVGIALRGTPGLLETRIDKSVGLLTPVSLVTPITGTPVVVTRVVAVVAAVVVTTASPRHHHPSHGGSHTAGTAEEQAKNFQWGLRGSTLNHLMCIQFTDVAQVANAARNYEILHERDDDDAERPDKRQNSGDRHQPTTQQSSHRNHGHNNDRHGSDRRGSGDNHRSNNNYSSNNNMLNFKSIQSSSTHKHDPNITV
nr:zinc finger, CCHC-type, retrotransposon Gag domain protein [Tanacetum cinerariifolium]